MTVSSCCGCNNDGKHINIKAPPNSGSECCNLKKKKKNNSAYIILRAIAPGNQSNGGVFKNGSILCGKYM